MQFFNGRSSRIYFNGGKSIADWSKGDILNWLTEYKRKAYGNFMKYEKIAVIKRSIEFTSNFMLRDIQLLALLVLLNSEENKGRLAQINTGEGKTVIIAMLAAFHALDGRKVDVITSSPELAIPHARDLKNFYSTMGLTVSENSQCNATQVYNADIVYGAAPDFQGDILREEFSNYSTRCKRKCDVAIVDEVDSMFIDGKDYIVHLSSSMPAMNNLGSILAAIWVHIALLVSCIKEEGNKVYFLDPANEYSNNEKSRKGIKIQGTKKEFIEKNTESYFRSLLSEDNKHNNDNPKIRVPNHLRDLVSKVQLVKWINNAILSKFYHKIGEDYIIRNCKIVPVDAQNTGVIQMNTNWSDGLHQFLQIKHGAKLTPENLTTNYLSNVSFFRRYGSNIYGLTGTLGNEETKALLHEVYNVDTVIIPPFKMKQYLELSPIILNDIKEWYHTIVKTCVSKLKYGRGALIITKYINETEKLTEIFKNEFKYDQSKIKLYKTDLDSSVIKEELQSGEVIITTNIAGRGTDIKLSTEIEENGGLHVCITFLPSNSRVEEQNIGRTSRTGNRGTSQFILYHINKIDIKEMKEIRNKDEKKSLICAKKEIETVTIKDLIFGRFCKVLNEFKSMINRTVDEYHIKSIEERFALWLKIHIPDKEMKSKENVLKDFEEFQENIMSDYKTDKLIINPYFRVLRGNKYINQKEYKNAINEFTKAIDLDKHFAEHAYYNRGYAYMAEYGNNVADNILLIKQGISDFKQARKLIKNRGEELYILRDVSNSEVFAKRIANKINLLSVEKSSIDAAIGMDITELEIEIKNYEEINNHKEFENDSDKSIDEILKHLREEKKKSESGGELGSLLEKKHNFYINWVELKEFLPKDEEASYEDEKQEFELNGFIGGFKIKRHPKLWEYVVKGFIGFFQIIVGVICLSFGHLVLAINCFTEGVGDIIHAVVSYKNKTSLNWKSWGILKLFGYTAGFIFSGLKFLYISITEFKILSGLYAFALSIWGMGNSFTQFLINFYAEKNIMFKIDEKIFSILDKEIQNLLKNNPIVKKMLETDVIRNNNHYEMLIKNLLNSIIHENDVKLNEISKRIKEATENYGKFIAMQTSLRIINKLKRYMPSFSKQFNIEITKIAQQDALQNILKNNNIQTQYFGTNDFQNADIDLSQGENEQITFEKETKCTNPKILFDEKIKNISTDFIRTVSRKITIPLQLDGIRCNLNKNLYTLRDGKSKYKYKNGKIRIVPKQKTKSIQGRKQIQSTEEPNHFVDKLIEELQANGGEIKPSHLGIVSKATNSPIIVLSLSGQKKYIIGEGRKGTPIKIQDQELHFENKSSKNLFDSIGSHENVELEKNSFWFITIAEQSGMEPRDLLNKCVKIMKKNKTVIAEEAQNINRLEFYHEKLKAMEVTENYYGRNVENMFPNITCGIQNTTGRNTSGTQSSSEEQLTLSNLYDILVDNIPDLKIPGEYRHLKDSRWIENRKFIEMQNNHL